MKGAQYSRRCTFTKEDGTTCRAWALREQVNSKDDPKCRLHSLSKEELTEVARRGGKHRAAQRRMLAEPKVRTGIAPTYSLADVLRVVAPALEATFEHDSSPDWGARLTAAGAILQCFPRYMRSTPEDVQALLMRALPSSVRLSQRDLQAADVYTAMRAEWDKLRIRHHPIHGLYVEEYPGYTIAPWQEREEVRPPKPSGRLSRTSDGRLVLNRDGEAPLLIEEDNLEELSREERSSLAAYLGQEVHEHG
jgi:hypothetical protein